MSIHVVRDAQNEAHEDELPLGCTNVTEALSCLEQACQVYIPDTTDELTPDAAGLAVLLALIRRAQAQLKDALEYLEDELARVMRPRSKDDPKTLEVPGLGVVTWHAGAKRTGWDSDTIWLDAEARILSQLSDDNDVDLFEAVHHAIEVIKKLARPSWRVMALKEVGLNANDYCEVSYGRSTVETPPVGPR